MATNDVPSGFSGICGGFVADGEGLGATGDAQTHTGHPREPLFPYNGRFKNEKSLIFFFFFLSEERGSLHGLLLPPGA